MRSARRRHAARARVLDIDCDLDRAHGLACELGLADDLGDALTSARSRLRLVAHELGLADTYALGLARPRVLGLAEDLARASARAHALGLAGELAEDLARASADVRALAPRWRRARQVAPSAVGLLAAAARLLPAADRGRYAEEYLSELWELAQAGAGRIRQLRYAFCQLRNALPMSVALRSPRRRSSVP